MLNLVWLSRQADKKNLWSKFDPAQQTWIISDRKTKFFFQKSLLHKTDIISDPVKRVQEFWKELLKTADPEMRILEDLGSRVQARDFLLKEGKSEWCTRPRAPQKLIDACQNMASLITHDLVNEYLADFETEFKSVNSQFLEIANLGKNFYLRAVEKKRLPKFFLPYYLSQIYKVFLSDRRLIFDLGFEMSEGDKELIQFLSKTNDVTVLIPAKDPESLEGAGLYSYRNFGLGLAQVNSEKTTPDKVSPPRLSVWRCSSPEAEARKAVEQIAYWIKKGAKPSDICVTAENFSTYESILRHDLDWEGIGLHRKIQTVVSASRLFRALNARLLIVKGILRAAVLEEAFLSVAIYKGSNQRRKERSVLKPILHDNQVPLPEIRGRILALRSRHKRRMAVIEFESMIIELFKELIRETAFYEDALESEQRNELFLNALGKLRSEVGDQELDFNQWIEAWQEVTNSLRLPIKAPAENGVWGVDLNSAEEAPGDYIIVLGAVETSHRQSIGLGPDKLNYLKDKGFDFEGPSKKKTDPYLSWLISSGRGHVVLSCPKTDTAGKSMAASALWLRLASQMEKNLEVLDFARHTNWIDAQKMILQDSVAQEIDTFKKWDAGTTQKISALVSEELNGRRKISLGVQEAHPLKTPLSASRLESYWECPYKFFARAQLALFDEEDLEVEPSPQKKGQWLHAAVEEILGSETKLEDWTDEKLAVLIDGLDEVQKQVSSDIWPSIQQRFLRQIRRFINYEIEWQKLFPRSKPFKLEAEIKGTINWTSEDPTIRFGKAPPDSAHENWAVYKGSIDRVDMTAEHKAVIIDYKSGAASASNISSWLKNGKFQLALYADAFESGLHDGELRKVIAAQYYSLKKLEREKGFKIIDEDLVGILPTEKSASAISQTEHAKSLGEIRQGVQQILEKIRSGEMTPAPHSEKLCLTCSWRTSCRAPHLS